MSRRRDGKHKCCSLRQVVVRALKLYPSSLKIDTVLIGYYACIKIGFAVDVLEPYGTHVSTLLLTLTNLVHIHIHIIYALTFQKC